MYKIYFIIAKYKCYLVSPYLLLRLQVLVADDIML